MKRKLLVPEATLFEPIRRSVMSVDVADDATTHRPPAAHVYAIANPLGALRVGDHARATPAPRRDRALSLDTAACADGSRNCACSVARDVRGAQ